MSILTCDYAKATPPLAVCLLDKDLRIIHVNDGFKDLVLNTSGVKAANNLVGKPLAAAAPRLAPAVDCARQVRDEGRGEAVGEVLAEDDEQATYGYQCQHLKDADRKTTGILLIFRSLKCEKEIVRSLSHKDERITALLNTALDAIVSIDADGNIDLFNRTAEQMFGYNADEARGRNIRLLMPDWSDDKEDGFLVAHAQRSQSSRFNGLRCEVLGRRKDGSLFPIALSIGQEDNRHHYIAIIRDLTQRKALEARVLSTADRIQREIGQSLHDDVAQEIMGLRLKADTLKEKTQDGDSELLMSIISGLERTRDKVRKLSHNLIPTFIDADFLKQSLTGLVEELLINGNLDISLDIPDDLSIRNSDAATQLYHITQEAINNAIRHGEPRRLHIELEEVSQVVMLRICDDGNGFHQRTGDGNGNGRGLETMQYRAGVVGGQVSINSKPGDGTEVICYVPNNPPPFGQQSVVSESFYNSSRSDSSYEDRQ